LATSSGTPTLIGGLIDSNAASGSGGGVQFNSSTATFNGTQISNNTAPSGAGATISYGTTSFESTSFINNTAAGGLGGGLAAQDASLTFNGGYFQDNTAASGGGAWLRDCTVSANGTRFLSNTASAGNGGGIYVEQFTGTANLTLVDATFESNQALTNPAGNGGGLYISGATAHISDSTFEYNSSANWGGGLSYMGPLLQLKDTLFRRNYAANQGGGMWLGGGLHGSGIRLYSNASSGGGAIGCMGGWNVISNSLMVGNTASSGGAIFTPWGTLSVINSTLYANQASAWAGGIDASSGTVQVRNSILWANNAPGPAQESGADLAYSIVQDGGVGTNVYTFDPSFVSPPTPGNDGVWGTDDDIYGDLRLKSTSSAIDAGDSFALPADGADVDADGNVAETLPLDMDGGVRRFDRLEAAAQLVGSEPAVDLGPYEPKGFFVDSTAAGVGDGSSWVDAFTSLQTALAASVPDETVYIAAGTYKPTPGSDRAINFVPKNRQGWYGSFPAGGGGGDDRDLGAHPTILSGAIGTSAANDNSYNVIKADNVTFLLDGLEITEGVALPSSQGGGIRAYNSTMMLTSSLLTGNYGYFGGGIYLEYTSATIEDTTISNNTAAWDGGGLYADSSTVILNSVVLDRNQAEGDNGGGLFAFETTITGEDTTWQDNSAAGCDGGVFLMSDSSMDLLRSDWYANRAYRGGATCLDNSDARLVNSRLIGNQSDIYGGGVYADGDATFAATNSLWLGNAADADQDLTGFGGALALLGTSAAEITQSNFLWNLSPSDGTAVWADADTGFRLLNSIIVGDKDGYALLLLNGTSTVMDNLILNGYGDPEDRNQDAQPLFLSDPDPGVDGIWGTRDAGEDWGDLHLAIGSPGVDDGYAPHLPVDWLDVDDDGDVAETLPWDYSGFTRIWNVGGVGNAFSGELPVDIGWLESTSLDLWLPLTFAHH